ncbi:hypothetical protein [Brevundimonas naejangsanensis]|uniref:hypothetical protein n=1 Tax=Brevundimonas naejangsanensis TaxID=588932 RepID=UPI0026EBBFE4|nr:hypothetical protein [Brevundimonas naejangsanensis]
MNDDLPVYEPSLAAWGVVGALFPAGVWANVALEQASFSVVGLAPFFLAATLIYPVGSDRHPAARERLVRGPRRPTPWWTARSPNQWAGAWRRVALAGLILLALFGVESVMQLLGLRFAPDY